MCKGLAVEVQAQTCGTIGTDAHEYIERRAQHFYLNIQDPTQCDGTINQIDYCYYLTDQFSVRHRFTFAVYRESYPGNESYTAVSSAFTTGTNMGNHGRNSFSCRTYSLEQTVQIQTGDIIGVCIYDPPDHQLSVQLDVVGDNAGSDRYVLEGDNTGCGNSAAPMTVSSLVRQESRVIHVYASVGKLLSNMHSYSK